MELKQAICPNCGAHIGVAEEALSCKCQYCEGTFRLDTESKPNVQVKAKNAAVVPEPAAVLTEKQTSLSALKLTIRKQPSPGGGAAGIIHVERKGYDLNCPVDILSYDLLPNGEECFFRATFCNLAADTVMALRLEMAGYNSFEEQITVSGGEWFELLVQDLTGPKGATFHMPQAMKLPKGEIRRVDLRIKQIRYKSGEIINIETANFVMVNPTLNHKDAVIVKSLFPQAKYIPEKHADYWLCLCGRPNKYEQKQCLQCEAEREQVFQLDELVEQCKENKRVAEERAIVRRNEELVRQKQNKAAWRKKIMLAAGVLVIIVVMFRLAVLPMWYSWAASQVEVRIAAGDAEGAAGYILMIPREDERFLENCEKFLQHQWSELALDQILSVLAAMPDDSVLKAEYGNPIYYDLGQSNYLTEKLKYLRLVLGDYLDTADQLAEYEHYEMFLGTFQDQFSKGKTAKIEVSEVEFDGTFAFAMVNGKSQIILGEDKNTFNLFKDDPYRTHESYTFYEDRVEYKNWRSSYTLTMERVEEK